MHDAAALDSCFMRCFVARRSRLPPRLPQMPALLLAVLVLGAHLTPSWPSALQTCAVLPGSLPLKYPAPAHTQSASSQHTNTAAAWPRQTFQACADTAAAEAWGCAGTGLRGIRTWAASHFCMSPPLPQA